jgi:hypothetical protein
MPRPTKKAQLHTIHQDALQEFDEIQVAVRDERLQCVEDRRFYAVPGAQWWGGLDAQFENKPRFEVNKTHLAVIRVYSEYRNNRITVDFQSRDGSTDDKMSDTCDGLYRADEKACTADEAYDNTFEEGSAGGMGALRLRSVYEDEDDEENDKQRVVIDPIFEADKCVFFNLDAKRYDKADAKRCYVLTAYTHRAYEEEFGDTPDSWPQSIQDWSFDWYTPDIVWVCELYRIEEHRVQMHWFQGLDPEAEELRLTEDELTPERLEELLATGYTETRQKKVRQRKVVKYLMSGGKMLSDGEVIPGKLIPVVPYYGKRLIVDGIERHMGLVRLAKDAQRLVNLLLSWLADIAARSPLEVPIMTPEQIGQHGWMWASHNIENFSYLLAEAQRDEAGNPIPGSQVPAAYTKVPNIPPAMAALAQIASQALDDMLGNQQAGEKIEPHLSGRAVELIQNRLDMQTFIYMSNFAKTMKRCGEVWLSMMRDICVEPSRRMKTIGLNGETGSVVLNQPAYDADTGEEYTKNDITAANFEVDVNVGPSSSSRRQATVRGLTEMKANTQDPEMLQVLDGLILMNMEGEGIADAREWARKKMVKQGVVKPTEEEAQELAQAAANQPPDPNAVYLAAAAEEAQANAGNARAKQVQTIADADLKRAQTEKTYAEIMENHNAQLIGNYSALMDILNPPEPAAMAA